MEKIDELETQNTKMRDEFNIQRAKMKDLFLQKEGLLIFKNIYIKFAYRVQIYSF